MEITLRGAFDHSPTILHRMLANPCIERYLDIIRYMLSKNPYLLFLRDENKCLPCDYIYLKVNDTKAFKYDLFADMLNLISKIYNLSTPSLSKVPTTGIPLANTEAVLSNYRVISNIIIYLSIYKLCLTFNQYLSIITML